VTRDDADGQGKEDEMSQTGSPPRIRVLGRSLRVLERIATIGALMGLDRSSSYRMARRESWPMVGSTASGWVLTMQVLDRYGIEYRLEADELVDLPVGSQAASRPIDCPVGHGDGCLAHHCTLRTDERGIAPRELGRDDKTESSQ
jgi:hypothetical protein